MAKRQTQDKTRSRVNTPAPSAKNTPPKTDGEQLAIIAVGASAVDKRIVELEHELAAAKRLIHSVFNAVSTGICITNENGIFVDVNESYCKIYGYSREEVVGQHFTMMVPPKQRKRLRELHDAFITAGAEPPSEFEVVGKKGEPIVIEVSAELLVQPDGQRYKVTSIKDITAMKRAEKALQATEKHFRALVENGADAIAIIGADGKTTYVSPSITRVLGYTEVEALQLNLFEVIHPDDVAGVAAKMEEVLQKPGVPIAGHTSRTKHKDGSWRWLEATITNLLHEPSVKGIVDNFRDVTSRVEAENELKASEEKYRSLFSFSPLPKWIYDIDTFEMLDVNETAIAHYGYSREEFLRMTIKDFSPEPEWSRMMQAHEEIQTQKNKIHFGIFTHKRKQGELIKMDITGHPIQIDSRNCMMVVSHDVTEMVLIREIESLERELMEESLREQINMEHLLDKYLKGLEQVFPAMKASVLRVENNKMWRLAAPSLSPTYADAFNGQAIGKQAGSCGTAAFTRKRVIVSDIATDSLWENYKTAALAEGLKASWSQPIFNSKGEVIATFANYYDTIKQPSETELEIFTRSASLLGVIMESHNKSRAIALSNERYEIITQATSDAVWDWDITHNTLFWGKGFKSLFGYDVEKISPTLQSWIEHIHPEDIQAVQDSLHLVLEDPTRSNWQQEYRYLKVGGDFAHVVDRGVVIRDENGQALRMVGAMTDITHRKEYEESLKNITRDLEQKTQALSLSNKELEQFAYVASHDLQEPLRMVTSFLSKIEDRYEPLLDERGKKYIRLAVDGATRMRSIILDLLEYSRSGRIDLRQEEVDLNEVIGDVKKLYHASIEEKEAEIVYEALPVIKTARIPVQQLFRNLINNSLKYARSDVKPRIEIGFSENDTHWRLSVRDNGIGIPPEFHDKLFILFQRLHNRREYAGTGIGLAVCKKIVQRLGGEIGVESEAGKGATFFFTLSKLPNP